MIPENEFFAFVTEYKADIIAFIQAIINFFTTIFSSEEA
jgi:hypothetical protein